MWWPFRTRLGVPSRKREQPDTFLMRRINVKRVNDDGTLDYDRGSSAAVAPDEFPRAYIAFTFPAPAVLAGRDPAEPVKMGSWIAYIPDDIQKLQLKDKEGFLIAPGADQAFCRMLAKIAHAYAAAELGLDAFAPALDHYIRDTRQVRRFEWIGADELIPPPRPVFHDIRWRIQSVGMFNYLVVDLRLFSFLGSPQYHIVVGQTKRPLNQLPFLEQPLYTIDIKPPLPCGEFVPIVGDFWSAGA